MANTSEQKVVFKDYDIIRSPIVTEKSNRLAESNQYFFFVDKRATKHDIKGAIERIFEVKVKSVNTMIHKGKKKVFRGREGVLSDVKKAMVRLESGQTISFV